MKMIIKYLQKFENIDFSIILIIYVTNLKITILIFFVITKKYEHIMIAYFF